MAALSEPHDTCEEALLKAHFIDEEYGAQAGRVPVTG